MSNKKKKILITHFPNLNNYGTGMMGLIVIQYLMDNCGKNNIKIYNFSPPRGEGFHPSQNNYKLK
jgi:hypothetical protein